MRNRISQENVFWIIVITLALGLAAIKAWAEDHPAFGTHHVTTIRVESEVPDIDKLEARAIDILRKPGTLTGEVMTLAEARAVLRVDGRTDVLRCGEIILAYTVGTIPQMHVVATLQVGEHPVQP